MQSRQVELFHFVMIKPSHYDDDGYPIQWLRSDIPANTLAAVNGLAIDCQRRARRHAGRRGGFQDQRPTAPQFFFEKIRRRARLVGFQRIRADDLSEPVRAVRRRPFARAHFIQKHTGACLRRLPRGFDAC